MALTVVIAAVVRHRPAPVGFQVLVFPRRESTGDLYVLDRNTTGPQWTPVGMALGRVFVPEGRDLRLVIPARPAPDRPTLWRKALRAIGFKDRAREIDLSPLGSLPPESLHELHILDNAALNDDKLAHLGHLRSLRWLVITGSHVSGDGLAHLDELPSLRILFTTGYQPGDYVLQRLDQTATPMHRVFDQRYDPTNGMVDFSHIMRVKQ